MEYDGTNLYFTPTGTTRRTIAYVDQLGSVSTVAAGAGSTTAPSISFSGDSDTGLFSNGADVMGITTGGTTRFNISSTGLQSPTTGGALITSANGSATSPTFSFAGDADTGWFRPAADTLAASTAGSERLRVTSTGNVGIGTTSPSALFHVSRSSPVGSISSSGTTVTGASTNFTSAFSVGDQIVANNQVRTVTAVTNSTSLSVDTAFSSDLSAGTLYNRVGAIFGSGHIGIGTTTPTDLVSLFQNADETVRLSVRNGYPTSNSAAEVTVRNDVGGSASLGIRGAGASSNGAMTSGGGYVHTSSSAGLALVAENGVANIRFATGGTSERMRIDSSGRIGIGTTSPSNTLSFDGSAARTVWMKRHPTANTAGNSLTLQAGGATSGATDRNGGALILSSGTATGTGSSSIQFRTATDQGSTSTTDNAPTTKMTLLGNGNLGVGTASPSNRLTSLVDHSLAYSITSMGTASALNLENTDAGAIFTSLRFRTTKDSADAYIAMLPGGSTNTSSLVFHTEGSGASERLRIDSNGRVGIGTSSPAVSLDLGNQTDAIRVPNGNESTHKSAITTPLAGMIRWNTTNAALEVYNGSAWVNLATTSAAGALTGVSSISGSGAVSVSSGGTNQNLTLAASGTGAVTTASPLTVTNATASTNPTTGAFIVSGGAGIGGALNTTGSITSNGQIRSVGSGGTSFNNSTTTVDWNNGNNQSMSVACTSTTLNNLLDGGTYNLAVTETGSTTCAFSSSGLTFFYSPTNGPRISGARTIYSFARIGTAVYVTWTSFQ